MRQVLTLPTDLLTLLDEYKTFIDQNRPDKLLPNYTLKGKFASENRHEYAASLECLNSFKSEDHDGYPPDSYGYDLNEPTLKREMQMNQNLTKAERDQIQLYIEKSQWIDDNLGAYIGYKFCALKMWYPENGYIAWHTNWNVPGFNCLFTHSDGSGYWRHIDPTDEPEGSLRAPNDKMVHLQDKDGWHCKLGYYGEKHEHDKLLWHSAYGGPRITLGFVVADPDIWEDIVEEITSAENSQ